MTIDKLPSGSYRIRQSVDKKRYTVIVNYKPTKAEAMALVSKKIESRPVSVIVSFEDACKAYIESKSNVLSPTTLKEYKGTVKRLPDSFKSMRISQIRYLDVQKVVNDLSVSLAPKTVANYAHFITSVLKAQGVDIGTLKLPQREKKTPYIPTEEDVKAVLNEVNDTEYEIPITLCCFGLRRSEVCALTIDDLDGNNLTINKAKVKDEHNEWVIKTTKTTESTRTMILPDDLAEKIRQKGYIYKGSPSTLLKVLNRVEKKLGIEHFSGHKLRHFFASYLHQNGFTDKQIQEMGGWKTDNIMKTVYQHAMEMDKAKQIAADKLSGLFS